MTAMRFFATLPKGMETLLAAELAALGAGEVLPAASGAHFSGTLETALRVCLWSRLAGRVLMPIASFPAATPGELYDGIRAVPWEDHLSPGGTLAVNFTGGGPAITHSQFGAQKVKDAIVDRFRERFGRRPSVDLAHPDLRVNVHLEKGEAVVRLDLSGESLHRRGYRFEGMGAPLKENLAAAILLRGGWPETASAGGPFVDPLCGSGTLPIEAALMAAGIAPGLLRTDFGFLRWRGNEPGAWEELLAEAEARRVEGLARPLPPIVGSDQDGGAVKAAMANAARAGVSRIVTFAKRPLADCRPPEGIDFPGLLATNPPYGERLGSESELRPLYEELGARLRGFFPGWRAAVFTGNPDLTMRLGIRARRRYALFNGPLRCALFTFRVRPEFFMRPSRGRSAPPPAGVEGMLPAAARAVAALRAHAAGTGMLANRLRKDMRTVGAWAAREGIGCYRLYDADIPEYALAVDLYRERPAERLWAVVQEYEAPASIDPVKARKRLDEALAAIPEALEIPPERVVLKVRRRQRGRAQYEKMGREGDFHEVAEGGLRFLVNFTDYLDTGLFLDHRPTRELIREMAGGKRFLNLFCYTGTASVYAAAASASSTTGVDMSRTYLDWARRNLALNGFTGKSHELARADCLKWLRKERRRFGLIFLDPPTFSASKRMEGTLDVQRDHVRLIRLAADLLEPGGMLLFSTNFRKFRLEEEALAGLAIEEITRATIPLDFERNPRIHRCWRITRR